MNHRARKRFGQNFLTDPNAIDLCLASFNAKPGQHIIEIGPGLGALTVQLMSRLGKLEVIELDRNIVPKLKKSCAAFCEHPDDLTIYNEDVLRFDFDRLYTDERPLRIIGNLPYNISTPLIFRLLGNAGMIQDMYFMLQKEVVDRMVAAPGNKQYGRLGIMVQYYCKVERLFDVDASAFSPPPKVQSAFVQLLPYKKLPLKAVDENLFARVVTQAFSLRRKTLRNCLKEMINDEALQSLGIDPSNRAEQLAIADFISISNYLASVE